jgi:hypothetical protein
MKMKTTGTLARIVGTDAWLERKRQQNRSRMTEVGLIDPTPDRRRGQDGRLAVKVCAQIRHDAKKAGYDWALSQMDVYELFIAPCTYCGVESGWPPKRNGIDRIDSSKGYVAGNVVTSCRTCNMAKGTGTFEELLVWAKRFALKNGLFEPQSEATRNEAA